jgi:hypothetical protein
MAGWLGPPQVGEGQCTYRYVSGEFFNESVPSVMSYAEFMFKLSEKFKRAVSVKYHAPGEELDPHTLITIGDDDDLRVRARGACMLATGRPAGRGGAPAHRTRQRRAAQQQAIEKAWGQQHADVACRSQHQVMSAWC